jgi:hypothetical protein
MLFFFAPLYRPCPAFHLQRGLGALAWGWLPQSSHFKRMRQPINHLPATVQPLIPLPKWPVMVHKEILLAAFCHFKAMPDFVFLALLLAK